MKTHSIIRHRNHKVWNTYSFLLMIFFMFFLIPLDVWAETQRPKLVWILSQPALTSQNSRINQTLKFPIGFKPNFDRTKLLTKRFTHKVFFDRSRNR